MSSTSPALPRRGTAPRTLVAALPAAGPAWFGAVMGTAMLASLMQLLGAHVHGGVLAARVLLVVGWAALIGLSVAFGRRCRREPGTFAKSWRPLVPMAQWGMVSMGVLAVGSATSTVLPPWAPGLAHLAWVLDGVAWVLGSALGFVLALGFAARLVLRDPGEPTTVWGLAVVAPMVTATVGATLAPHAGPLRVAVLVVALAGFATALCLGAIVFGVAYHHHWRVAPVPVAASASAWIPLGIVGQSVAAAQLLAGELGGGVLIGPAHAYGAVMLLLGAPLVAWAVRVTVRGFRAGMPFSPGWWAMTFPVGTIVLGAHLLAEGTGWLQPQVLSTITLVVLVGTWSLCAVASARAVTRTA